MSQSAPSTGPRRAPTMADVAQRAGVSHQTVSRVLSNHPNVRDTTRADVLRAIEELGYRRNSSARALVTRRTLTLGVVACNPTLFGPASMLFGLEEAARDEGFMVSAVTLRRYSAKALSEAIDHLSDWGVEGIVVIVPHRAAVAALADLRLPFPVVTVEGGHSLPIPGVSVDQDLGARLVTGHLLGAGHRTVWHVAGPSDWLEAEARVRGWRSTLEDAGVEVPPPLVGDWTPLSGYRAGQELAGRVAASGARRRSPDVTAVFVANDQMALGVLRAFREAGLSVPGQVAIAGFDDIPEAEFFAPPLTTVRQDFAAVGQASIRLLLSRLEASGMPNDERVVIEPRLIVRSSSTPA
ncbi:LacI family DNA-binding transcriptional regulator [Streptomyces cocklensis]|uniref:Transcriptional regulator, LacI family n=1 Tax=Actinacidiphila cocklensis TaxID=887465 RepID=A0A9W4DXW1_9ACTN|nr:LacI family DNA-binding transcriptional regulator [Actinacidiphila cocklensis]MDD1059928.1 LacI family DNA-binding transcriptional regulator [Actinacidiphila cocklensis]WSX72787.1 LacI family DNA-binding transcriptional regulator [Streptomyces sp. NBC_00899]WSX81145.1 LacI family DNA-binding transcriptional regulator [Streptomyces sp. NBC_00899]CAG6395882.1 Transcriptional regulator, LacI family [Actinacidiphila cocklensis]